MSRAAESEHTKPRREKESESPDLDAEHDPAVSRRAAQAGHQAAAAEQNATATNESHQAVQNALIMSAARLRGYAKSIRSMIDQKQDEAGPFRQVQGIQELWGKKEEELARLAQMMLGADSPERHALEARRLYSALFEFDQAWRAGKAFAERSEDTLEGLIPAHHPKLEEIFTAAGITEKSWKGDSHRDGRSDDALRIASLKQNTIAATELAESVGLALSAGNQSVAQKDFFRLSNHLLEVQASLGEMDRKSTRAFVKSIRKLRAEVNQLLLQIQGGNHGSLFNYTFNPVLKAHGDIGSLIDAR